MCYGMGCNFESLSGECMYHGRLPYPCPSITRSITDDFDDAASGLDTCETKEQAQDWLNANAKFFEPDSPLAYVWSGYELTITEYGRPYATFIFGDE